MMKKWLRSLAMKKDSSLYRNISTPMVLYIEGRCVGMIVGMGMVCNCGQTEPNMKVNGATTKQRVGVLFGMLRVMSMKESSRMIKRMATEFTPMSMDPSMKGTGRMICRKATGQKSGQMAQTTQELI